jgi:hypothetical protein
LKLRGIKVKLVDGDPASKKVLNSKAAGLQSAEAVVLCGLGQQPAGSADVQVGREWFCLFGCCGSARIPLISRSVALLRVGAPVAHRQWALQLPKQWCGNTSTYP